MKKKLLCLSFFFFSFYLLFLNAQDNGIKVIANGMLEEASITENTLKDIYSGEKRFWRNNKKIVVTMLVSSETQQKFHKKYLHVPLAQFVHQWKLKIFSGKGKFPKTFDTEEEMISFVAQTDGAIGYISSDTLIKPENVKILSISEK